MKSKFRSLMAFFQRILDRVRSIAGVLGVLAILLGVLGGGLALCGVVAFWLIDPSAYAATGCIPNPNDSAPPFVNGCAITAKGLNNIAGGSRLSYAGLKYAADPTGVVDATAALNACLAGTGVATCLVDPMARLKILGTVSIPAGKTLKCSDGFPVTGDSPAAYGTAAALLVAATGKIQATGNNFTIQGCVVYPGFTLPQTASSGWTGTALLSNGHTDFHVIDTVVFGYDTCIDAYGTNRVLIQNVVADCEGVTHGAVRTGNNGDGGTIRNLKIQPQAMVNGDCTASRRAGNGLHLQNDTSEFLDGVVAQNFKLRQIWFDNSATAEATNLWVDNLGAIANGCSDTTSVGIEISAVSTAISILHANVNGTNTGILFDGNVTPAHFYVGSVFFNSVSQDCLALGGVGTHAGQVIIGSMATNPNATVNCTRYGINFRDTTGNSGLRSTKALFTGVNGGAAPYIYFAGPTSLSDGGQVKIDTLATDLAAGISPYGGTLPVPGALTSAATLLLPSNGCNGRTFFRVTGTTNITELAGMCPGQELTLIFDGVLTVFHGNHILLAASTNFTTGVNSMLKLSCFPIGGVMYCKEGSRAF